MKDKIIDGYGDKSFRSYPNHRGLLEDMQDNPFPARFYAWKNETIQHENESASFFGFVQEGIAKITASQGVFTLRAGMYFCIPQALRIKGESAGILVEQMDFKGFFQIGGPIENRGRLQYIDGCTDSLLIAPPLLGNPCLNLLHIPPQTFQSQHTHPSFRIGVIVKGSGKCMTPDGYHRLHPGLIFMIPADALHSFKTEDDDLLVIAYHPDSDFGPTHENHPMINRTILDLSS